LRGAAHHLALGRQAGVVGEDGGDHSRILQLVTGNGERLFVTGLGGGVVPLAAIPLGQVVEVARHQEPIAQRRRDAADFLVARRAQARILVGPGMEGQEH
jgi:hypothetical protein